MKIIKILASFILTMLVVFVSGCNTMNPKEEKELELELIPDDTSSGKIGFWAEQKRGTNFMNSKSLPDNYKAANEVNIEFIRLALNGQRTMISCLMTSLMFILKRIF